MSNSLPPLNALRAFESSARHLSFKKASEELNVTPSAISQQIKNLEDNLGVVLFHRSSSGLNISKEGQELLPVLEKAFNSIADAVNKIKNSNKAVLKITSSPAFLANWLGPKLPEFQKNYPDVDLHLHSSLDVMNIGEGSYDCAIRIYREKEFPALKEEYQEGLLQFKKLFSTELLMVCNPKLLKDKQGVKKIPKQFEDLISYNLIHFKNYNTWSVMLRYKNSGNIRPDEGIVCGDIDSLLKAIQSGSGIGLIDRELYEHPIYNQTLEEIFSDESPGKLLSYLVTRVDDEKNEAINPFKKWLIAEAKAVQGHYLFDQARKEMNKS